MRRTDVRAGRHSGSATGPATHRVARRTVASTVSGASQGAGGSGSDALRDRVRALAEESAPPAAEIRDLLHDHDLESVWNALSRLHRELDEASGTDLQPKEVARLRQRLLGLGWLVVQSAPQTAVRSYRELLLDISHDIRSPLNSILFLSEGLTSHQSGGLSTTQKRQAGIVYAAAASLLNLVNDLLDFSRTAEGDVGGVASIPFSVSSVVGDVKRLVAPLADYHETDLEVASSVKAPRMGDPQLLCRLLINLVSNAIEAADVGGRVEVGIEARGEDSLLILVADDGAGAELETVRSLLAPQPEERLTRMLHGRTHGLGLIIVGRLVRASGGSVSVEPRDENGGTRFSVELPFGPLQGVS
ncbi:MAG: HAMP domain-containing sensor histidine kinase [Candidatus Palauibacterales bacterium]|nr:HAMP domain-containing sensor histidine kinase [Candidatus Palauibacterales bacterium]